jgi:2-polyprenyl-3-methyl-5-hydroxy-6-metoxy-1,4-benzoquinol methylase
MSQDNIKPDRIFQFWFGYAAPLMLEAGVRHKIFDALDAGPKTAEQVATTRGVSPRGARILLNGLAGLEFIRKNGDQYSLSPESAKFLVSTKPTFMGGILRHTSTIIPNWLQLADVVKSGKPAKSVNQEGTGAEFFRDFVEDMFPMGIAASKQLADSLDLKGPVKVLDIAAGSGVWSIPIAQKYPDARVTVVDWEGVIPACKKVTQRMGVGDRYDYKPGDLLAVDFGKGYNVATLGHILHSEGEERSKRLIKKVFDALAPGGTIAIAEMIPNDDRTGPPHALIFAVNMLVHTDAGDTFTFTEMSRWLKAAGFTNPRTLDTPSPSPLILATRP